MVWLETDTVIFKLMTISYSVPCLLGPFWYGHGTANAGGRGPRPFCIGLYCIHVPCEMGIEMYKPEVISGPEARRSNGCLLSVHLENVFTSGSLFHWVPLFNSLHIRCVKYKYLLPSGMNKTTKSQLLVSRNYLSSLTLNILVSISSKVVKIWGI